MNKLNFNDICLIPRVVSSIRSRKEVDTSVKMGGFKLELPIIASPMLDVCNGVFGNKLIHNGCMGLLHRFCSVEEQVNEFKINKMLGAAIGINGDCEERFRALLDAGCRTFCIDVANGANIAVSELIENLLQINQEVDFIVGNVASAETFAWLSELPNVIGVRVGIAGGSACTTRNATGVYHPMASLIMECREKKLGGPLIIADGGIKCPDDFCKAIALGADCVMMGSALAASIDSPAELIKQNGSFYKVYHGSASFEIQQIYRKKPKYIEGKTTLLDFNNETLEQIIAKFSDGLKSSMSYFDAKTIPEFQKKVDWCCVNG